MKTRRIGFFLAILGLISAAVNPALAGPVEMKRVRQILKGDYRQGGDNASLELRLVGEGDEKKKAAATTQDPNNTGAPAQDPKVNMAAQQEVQEDVTVENCDCPTELPVPVEPPTGRGFPKWLLGLGAIPLVCLTGICTKDNPPNFTPPSATPTPPGGGVDPTPTPPVPEPATILLLGSGLLALGAAARRRRANEDSANEF